MHKLKLIIKRVALAVAYIPVLPLILLSRLGSACGSEEFFSACASFLALLPGMTGSYLRLAYYKGTLASISPDVFIGFGSYFSKRESVVGKYVNIASRCAGFISKKFGGRLAAVDGVDCEWLKPFRSAAGTIAAAYEDREFGRALREVMALADVANVVVNVRKPWELAKQEGREAELHDACSQALEAFRLLTLYLKPVLPKLAEAVEAFLDIAPLAWSDAGKPLPAGHTIKPYGHLLTRIDAKQIAALVAAQVDGGQGYYFGTPA